jgi:hypothetical protein
MARLRHMPETGPWPKRFYKVVNIYFESPFLSPHQPITFHIGTAIDSARWTFVYSTKEPACARATRHPGWRVVELEVAGEDDLLPSSRNDNPVRRIRRFTVVRELDASEIAAGAATWGERRFQT